MYLCDRVGRVMRRQCDMTSNVALYMSYEFLDYESITMKLRQARRHWGGQGGNAPPINCQTCFWRCYKSSLVWQQFWQQFILAIHAPHSSSAVYGPELRCLSLLKRYTLSNYIGALNHNGNEKYGKIRNQGQRNNAFEMKCYRKLLRIPYTAHRTNDSVKEEFTQ